MNNLRILDFDIENRPLAYLGPEYTTAEITAIAVGWVGDRKPLRTWLLGQGEPVEAMLDWFVPLYNEADIVTGHYIRKHDLPILNGTLLEHGRPPLDEKLVSDTKLDLVKHLYLSASQENLCETLGIKAVKVHMSNAKWREANRLTTKGLALTYARVVGDVLQHMQLRAKLLKIGALGPPKVWRP